MGWNTDWSNGVSETITEIQTIASNQVTDEANISALQSAAPYFVSTTGTTLSVGSGAEGKFLRVSLAGVVAGNAPTTVTANIGSGLVDVTPINTNGSGYFMFEFNMYFDGSHLFVDVPGSNPQVATSSATSFSIVLSSGGGTVTVSNFEAVGF
jgi:hypothetical protein